MNGNQQEEKRKKANDITRRVTAFIRGGGDIKKSPPLINPTGLGKSQPQVVLQAPASQRMKYWPFPHSKKS